MRGHVAPQVRPGDEGLAAVRAAQLLAVRVHRHVHLQRARLGEALPAVEAAVALLARVHALVALQVAGVGEALGAQRAHEGLLARVDPDVGLQVLQARQRLAAEAAAERPVAVVLRPPAGAPGEGEESLRRLLPGEPRLLRGRRRLPAPDAEREADAHRVARVRRVGAAGVLAQRILGSERRRRRLVHQAVVAAGFRPVDALGGGAADFPARPEHRRAAARYFLFGGRGRGFCLRQLVVNDAAKLFWRDR